METHHVRPAGRRGRPFQECIIYAVSTRISTEADGEIWIAAEAGGASLDRLFKGAVLRFAFDINIDFSLGGKAIELGPNIDVEFLIDGGVFVGGPDGLRSYEKEKRKVGRGEDYEKTY